LEMSTKEAIKRVAIEQFGKKGFHGTSVRDIAKEADCSIPMVYYYYNSKKELFDEIVYKEFIRLIERLNSEVERGSSLQDVYFNAIRQRKDLDGYDRSVYRLAIKVWLGYEEGQEVRHKLIEWERARYDRNRNILSRYYDDPEKLDAVTEILVGIVQNFVERILLLEEDLPDEKIRRALEHIIA